jgi:hypothetical protein
MLKGCLWDASGMLMGHLSDTHGTLTWCSWDA